MTITRAKIDEIKTVLGLDHDLTHSVTIMPRTVHIQTVALVDGHPSIENGEMAMQSMFYEIEEPA